MPQYRDIFTIFKSQMCVVINFKMGQWGKNISFAEVLKFSKKLPCQENNPTGNALCFAILMRIKYLKGVFYCIFPSIHKRNLIITCSCCNVKTVGCLDFRVSLFSSWEKLSVDARVPKALSSPTMWLELHDWPVLKNRFLPFT